MTQMTAITLGFILGQEQLAQYLQVAAQDAQPHVAFVAKFALVA